MRHGSDERIAVTSALATMLAALTLSPLVQGISWLFVASIAVVTTMVTGIVARQLLRWWLAVAIAQALVLALTLLVLFARSRVLEGAAAFGVLGDLFEAGLVVSREQAPPVESTQGVVLLIAAGIGLVALLVDLMAATLRQPALAGLPLLAIYCVPAALIDGGLPWYFFLAAAAGFLLLLTADSGDRVRAWGRVLASGREREQLPTPGAGGLAQGGRRVGAAAIAMAVFLPALVPGLSNQIIGGSGDGDGDGSGGRTITRINPILDLRQDLENRDNTPLLTYSTDQAAPAPLRIVTADVFDGKTWAPSTRRIPRSQNLDGGLPTPPGLAGDVATSAQQTRVSIGPLNETYLPLPYPATSVEVRGEWLYDADTLNVIGDGITTENLEYVVEHLEIEPTAQQLADSPPPGGAVNAEYLNLPDDLPAVISATAREVAGDGTDYQMAVRLQRWFRTDGGFQYSLDAPETRDGASGSDAIAAFLDQKRGYCVHYASTMAVMARVLGIPARVAIGFLPGTAQANNTRVISANDAHAWPELYFQNIGWVRFEPTPRSGLTSAPEWSVPPAGVLPEDDPAETTAPEAEPSAQPSAEASSQAPQAVEEAAPEAASATNNLDIPWRALLIVLVVLLVIAAPKLAATIGSRRRWARAGWATAFAEAAWDDLRLGLSDLGVSWAAAWTPRAVERQLLADYAFTPPARSALDRLTFEIENARYAPPDDELGRSAAHRQADVAMVISEVAALVSGQTRWSAKLWPRSGIATLAGVGPWVNLTTDRAGQQLTSLGTQFRGKLGRGTPPAGTSVQQPREKVGSDR